MTIGIIAVFIVAAVMDLRSRHVPNALWIGAAAALAPTALMQDTWWIYVTTALAIVIITSGLHALRVFGGADAKGVVFLALAIPPSTYYAPWAGRTHVVLDTLIIALLLTEGIRRVLRVKSMPFFAVYAPVVAVTLWLGPILWWPMRMMGLP